MSLIKFSQCPCFHDCIQISIKKTKAYLLVRREVIVLRSSKTVSATIFLQHYNKAARFKRKSHDISVLWTCTKLLHSYCMLWILYLYGTQEFINLRLCVCIQRHPPRDCRTHDLLKLNNIIYLVRNDLFIYLLASYIFHFILNFCKAMLCISDDDILLFYFCTT